MSDRTVSTDALATLGTIIDDSQKRDAIHLAVIPCVAPCRLAPGQHVAKDGTPTAAMAGVGIVDPFIDGLIERGQRFWLVIYPRVVTSLRHVWSHPAFQEEAQKEKSQDEKSASQCWISDYALRIGLHPDRLMEGADSWVQGHEKGLQFPRYLVDGGTLEGVCTDPEFWRHYEVVRGKSVKDEAKTNFFSCHC